MSELITLINYIAVGIFGSILSAAFCGIGKEKKQRNLIVFTVGVALIIEGIVYYFCGERVVHEFYPVFAHIPLVIVLWVITKRFLSSLSSVLTAYLCCQFRRWLALLFTFVFKNRDSADYHNCSIFNFIIKICSRIRERDDHASGSRDVDFCHSADSLLSVRLFNCCIYEAFV